MDELHIEDLVDSVERRVPNGRPLDYLTEAAVVADRIGELADELVGYFVDLAREAGYSWAEIGSRLGVSKQAAQKRFVVGSRGKRRSGLFTRFALPAREVVTRAVEHAEAAGHEEVDTGHLVLGLIDDEEGAAARAFVGIGVPLERIRASVEASLPPRAQVDGRRHTPFSDDSKKVLQLALREAIRSGSRQIGPEHVLLGILRDQGSSGATALQRVGIDRRAVEDWLASEGDL